MTQPGSSPHRAGASPLLLFLRANRGALAELLVSSVVINAFALALPLFSMLVYDKVVGNEIHDTLLALCLGVGLIFALDLALRIARVYMLEHTGARWDAHLDERLLRGVLGAPLSRVLPVGDVLARYRDLAGTRDVLSAQCLIPLADLPFVVLFSLALWIVAGPLVYVPLVMALLLFLCAFGCNVMMRARQKPAIQADSRKLSWLADVLMTRESLADPHAAQVAVRGMRPVSLQGARAGARARLWMQVGQQIVPVGISLTSVLTLAAGVYAVDAQQLSVGGLSSSSMLASRVVATICGLAPVLTRWSEFRRALAGLRAAVDLDLAPAAEVLTDAVAVAEAFSAEGVRLDQIVCSYPVDGAAPRRILDQLSIAFRPGELVAVVGASGAGKSTLLRLLAGHLVPGSGRLSFAAHVIDSDPMRRWLAGKVAFKPQEPVFLGDTLANIVAPGRALDDPQRVIAALRFAGLGPALDRGDLGLETRIGTNGGGLSGGQRQMLALARSLASDSPLLLLDEPTLGLDRVAQETLLGALVRERERQRCVVVATHTTELIMMANRVVVLDGGRVVADGPPAQLLQTRPTQTAAQPAAVPPGTVPS